MTPRRNQVSAARARGFTLPEALIVMAVVAILASMALPMMGDMLVNQRIKNASMELLAALNQARSEAIKSGGAVTVSALGTGWNSGWRITNADGRLIRQQQALHSALVIGGPDSVVYERDGRLPQAGMTAAFSINTDPPRDAIKARCVRVDLTGRPISRTGACS